VGLMSTHRIGRRDRRHLSAQQPWAPVSRVYLKKLAGLRLGRLAGLATSTRVARGGGRLVGASAGASGDEGERERKRAVFS